MRILTAFMLSLFTSVVMAADLTSKDVERWLKESPALQEWIEQHDDQFEELDVAEETFDAKKMIEHSIKQLKDANLYDQFNERITKAGYKNIEGWVDISHRISVGYLALMMESQVQARKDIEAQLAQVRATQMPAEQKAMMENMLMSSLAMMNDIEKVGASDKAAIRPYMKELTEMFESERDDFDNEEE